MIGIYSIIINQKRYIGQSRNISNRLNEHIRELKNNEHHSQKLQRAYNKYQTIQYEILEECNLESLDSREKYWIDYYDSYNNGYNMVPGGQTQEPWVIISKKVYVFNFNKELIYTFSSARECSRTLGIDQALLNKVLNKERKHCATKDGQWYIYSYSNNCPNVGSKIIKCGKHRDYYTIEKDNIIQKFDSGLAIIKFLECSRHTLPKVGEVKNIHGYLVRRHTQ